MYMLPAINWPVVLYLILFWFAHLTGGKNASVFIVMDRFHSVCKLPVCICFRVVLCLMVVVVGGVTGRFSGFLREASLSGVTLVN